ncbi:TPA: hypothetical protein ACFO86_000649 [Neisseria meningitidis]
MWIILREDIGSAEDKKDILLPASGKFQIYAPIWEAPHPQRWKQANACKQSRQTDNGILPDCHSDIGNAEKNTQIGYNPDKHTQGQQHGSLARSKIH